MRDETTTNARPKMATPSDATRRGPGPMFPPRRPGTAKSVSTTRIGPATTTQPGTSRSVRSTASPPAAPSPPRSPPSTARSEEYMVGSARITVTMPAAATAPAPM